MKILLIGKTGQIGSDILRNNMHHQIYAPDRAKFDICSRDTINAVIDDYQPNVVINTASFHDVPLCEAEPQNAFSVNCVAVRDLAIACSRIGSLFVTFSTDYVFDGEKQAAYQEDDKPSPLQSCTAFRALPANMLRCPRPPKASSSGPADPTASPDRCPAELTLLISVFRMQRPMHRWSWEATRSSPLRIPMT